MVTASLTLRNLFTASSKFITRILKQKLNLHSTCKFTSFSIIAFEIRYDFDRDGYIQKEDVRLVLSHIPIEKTILTNIQAEGKFTTEGGGK